MHIPVLLQETINYLDPKENENFIDATLGQAGHSQEILKRNGFVEEVKKKGRLKKFIEITLKYENKIPAISELKRISKPGQRIYLPYREIKRIRDGYGLAIISTSKG